MGIVKMLELAGVYTALVTPFRNGSVDYPALKALLQEQLDAKVAGIVPVGTSGESPTLTVTEHLKVIEEVINFVAGRCQIIAGTGANSTAEAVEFTTEARKLGADASLQVTPYYNKPTQEGVYRHFMTIAEKSELPAVIYNVPGRTGIAVAVETIARLTRNPLMVAVKEAAGSVERVNAIKAVCDMTVLSGDDSLTLPMMSVGASGVISVASNILPKEVVAMVGSALKGDFAAALQIHKKLYPLYRDLFIESNPIPIKAAMADMGLIAEEYRLPLCEMSAANREILRAAMRKSGIALKV